jgi:hypothetical protein|tara:strand:+ start:389 stop:508 length:120 start_codon:yes stop_codon:yes gene_type:complete
VHRKEEEKKKEKKVNTNNTKKNVKTPLYAREKNISALVL